MLNQHSPTLEPLVVTVSSTSRTRSLAVVLAAFLAMATLLLFPAAAGAQYGENPPGSTSTVLPTNIGNPSPEGLPNTNPSDPGTEVLGTSFAFTGGDVAAMAAVGAVLVGAGAGLVVAARRRRELTVA